MKSFFVAVKFCSWPKVCNRNLLLDAIAKQDGLPAFRADADIKYLPRNQMPFFFVFWRTHPNYGHDEEVINKTVLKNYYPRDFFSTNWQGGVRQRLSGVVDPLASADRLCSNDRWFLLLLKKKSSEISRIGGLLYDINVFLEIPKRRVKTVFAYTRKRGIRFPLIHDRFPLKNIRFSLHKIRFSLIAAVFPLESDCNKHTRSRKYLAETAR